MRKKYGERPPDARCMTCDKRTMAVSGECMDCEHWGELEKILRSFDWYYANSDDHRKFKRGLRAAQSLSVTLAQFNERDPERTKKLFETYAPKLCIYEDWIK